MTADLVKRLTSPMVPYDPEVDAQGFWEDLCAEAKDRIEALTTQLAEDADARKQIDHRLEELVGQVDALTAERDEAICGNHRSNEYEPTWAELTGVWKARAEAAEKELREMQAHIDHADAYHKAMLVAEAETRMTMAELADWTARAEAAEADNARLREALAGFGVDLDLFDAEAERAALTGKEVMPDAAQSPPAGHDIGPGDQAVAGAAQCCMCGKRGLLTADDGGPQCELHDGRWVCSAGCYDVALGIMLKPVAGAAPVTGLEAARVLKENVHSPQYQDAIQAAMLHGLSPHKAHAIIGGFLHALAQKGGV